MLTASAFYLTSDAARRIGVSARTISTWARLGKVHVLRTAGGVRLYPVEEVERLRQARAAGKAGEGQRRG